VSLLVNHVTQRSNDRKQTLSRKSAVFCYYLEGLKVVSRKRPAASDGALSSMAGAVNQIAWEDQIKIQADAEFDRVRAALKGASALRVGARCPLVIEALREINRIANTHRPASHLVGPNLKIGQGSAAVDCRERSVYRVLSA
jgi:hypothetical protein